MDQVLGGDVIPIGRHVRCVCPGIRPSASWVLSCKLHSATSGSDLMHDPKPYRSNTSGSCQPTRTTSSLLLTVCGRGSAWRPGNVAFGDLQYDSGA